MGTLQLRRMDTASREAIIFAVGEPVYDTETFVLYIGDGSTLGGINSDLAALADKADNVLTGYTSGAGTVAETDTVLEAIEKLNGNYVQGINSVRPAFQVVPASTQENIAVGTGTTVLWGTERFDVGNCFASNTFTAPITGKYHLSVSIQFSGADPSSSYYQVVLVTTSKTYSKALSCNGVIAISVDVIADLAVGNTAYIVAAQGSGTQQTDISTESFFCGYLVC